MYHVFVDGGGNWKRIVDRYLKLTNFDKVYVFEPNPIFYESYEGSDFVIITKAIWIEDCNMPFYISKDENQVASSLLQEKRCKVDHVATGITHHVPNYWHTHPIQVECVDFSKWLIENVMPHHNLSLKLDIEGAEYDVLWRMIDNNTISMVDNLYVEFHSDTIPEKKETEKKLIEALRECGVEPQEWD